MAEALHSLFPPSHRPPRAFFFPSPQPSSGSEGHWQLVFFSHLKPQKGTVPVWAIIPPPPPPSLPGRLNWAQAENGYNFGTCEQSLTFAFLKEQEKSRHCLGIVSSLWRLSSPNFCRLYRPIGESLLTSLFTFFLISIRLNSYKPWPYTVEFLK